ncbi:UxaA family hydrolase [Desulforhopalus singaporensis]|uniref:Altronate dehydratase large subunit n=1 Tax=Desulforhopalus singaporensis TaxID=91360 RepID=A0A1H0VP13_9BACT|nr:UxaA family hydrolase [Desulforhopalus singaporensis]SDP79816.1 altronate dehydratase large subunit [Desulforhopalus singaporensis]
MKFMGYHRPDGRVGIRNHIAIIPSVFCANNVVEQIARKVHGTVPLRHPVGCAQVGYDLELTARTLKAMATHPNVAAVLIIGLGCERFKPGELYEAVKNSGKPVEMLIIQEEGGSTKTINKGIKIATRLTKQERGRMRVPCDISELTIAVKCGGTDATSGLAANPVVGSMSDLLNQNGGSTILSELNELIGTEDMLAARAVNKEVADKIYNAIYGIEDKLLGGCDERYFGRNELISPGNYDGGVSNIVEKALGGVYKGGTAPVVDVLEYAMPAPPEQKGLFLMNYESHDGEVVTGMIGCGAQLVAFTSGRGNPAGFPIAPVIKLTGNSMMLKKMRENFDFSAGEIISGEATIDEKGKELFELALSVANGQLTSAETLNGYELFCVARALGIQVPANCTKCAKNDSASTSEVVSEDLVAKI